MTSISSVGSGLLAAFSGSLQTASPRAVAPPASVDSGTPTPSTVLALHSPAALEVVYARPQVLDEAPTVRSRAWASPQQDDISALMARNGGSAARGGLADAWRGLGGALLSRLAQTQTDYRQTMVDYFAPRAGGVAGVDALGTQALAGVANGAAKVSLTVQTRSGQTVELTIAVNTGANGGSRGLQVEVKRSGPLSSAERDALAQLSGGLDQALEGLGQPGKLRLDLSGLMAYDTRVLSGLALTVQNPQPGQALSSFALRLGADHNTVSLTGDAGEIALKLDARTPGGAASAQQRQAAIAQHLQQFDAAAQRSHADAALVALFKDAFTQLHATPCGQASPRDDLGPTLARQVQPLVSGLMDFEARFGGDFEKTNERGAVDEVGRADYQLSQETTVRRHGASGAVSVTQTNSEQLDAHYMQSRHGGMLDTGAGHYDLHKIKDHSTTTTLVESTKELLTRAVRTTEQHQLLTYEKFVNHRAEEQRETPRHERWSERLR